MARINTKPYLSFSGSITGLKIHIRFWFQIVDVVVAVSRNNGVPPAPPTLAITSTTGSTISLGWTPAPDGGAPLIAYHIHYHREFGDWDRVTILTIIFMANLPKKLEHFWI